MKRFGVALIIILMLGCLPSCDYRAEESAGEPKKPEIEAATTNNGLIFAWNLAYDITELLGETPFAAYDVPEAMPVYKNKYVTDRAGVPLKPISREEMRKAGEAIADVLGLNIDSEANYGSDNHLWLLCDETKIQVGGNESVYIEFGKTFPLPVELGGSNKEYIEALNYTAEVLAPLFKYWNMENPAASVSHDYSFGGEKHFECNLTGRDENPMSASVYFSEGYLCSIRSSGGPLDGEIMGEYPTITYDCAKALLLDGQCYSIVPLNSPIEENKIRGAVIGYKTQCYDEVFIPFYAFYVDITDREEGAMPEESLALGLKTFATYIVPAIEPEYLTKFPEIIVHFN